MYIPRQFEEPRVDVMHELKYRGPRNGHFKIAGQVEGKPKPTATESSERNDRIESKWST